MAEALRLFGIKALVTGAASGIGEAITRTFVKQGATVLAVDSANSNIETHFKSNRKVIGTIIDTLGPDAATKLVESAKSKMGGLDIVLNNFDLQPERPIADGDDAALSALLERKRNLLSNVFDAALPLLKKSPAGRIINLGCLRSDFARNGVEAFARSQAELADLCRAQAAIVGEFGINSTYIQPGAIMTPDSRRVYSADKELRDHCISHSAAKRLGEPVDIAKVALFLATDDSVFVSGTGIVVDGGAL